jgi:predicted AlkP superfamily phosphohydrolase/phosphomutase/tetratricopeptide (TPR) repeat protein
MKAKRKILILGWDAADWEVIDQLIAKGKMKTLAGLLQKGVRSAIQTLDPPISPMLWTTIATGKLPDKHGIVGFTEPDPNTGFPRPLQGTSRKVKAFWNMAGQYGLKSNIVAWWPSHPAEPIHGVMVSNFFQTMSTDDPKKWPAPKHCVHPPELEKELKTLRVHAQELTPPMVLPFVPNLFHLDEESKKHIPALFKEISHATTLQSISTWLMDNTEWDITAVYFEFLDHMSHNCMKFRAPFREGVDPKKFENFKDVVDGAYEYQDMMLEAMLQQIDEHTAVMILSDHGFESGIMRPRKLPKEIAGPTNEHSEFGVFFMCGPGIKKGERIYGTSVTDVTPTLLAYLGLPVGRDMDGKVLSEVFESAPEINWIDSWETHDIGNPGKYPDDVLVDPWDAKASMDQLVELGYIERPPENAEEAFRIFANERDYFLARNFAFSKRIPEAIALMKPLVERKPDHRFRIFLAQLYLQNKEYSACKKEINLLREEENADITFADFLEGKLELDVLHPKKAQLLFEKVLKQTPASSDARLGLSNALQRQRLWQEALQVLNGVLQDNPRNLKALFSKAICLLRTNNYEDAVDTFLELLEYKHHYPVAHFYFSEALIGIGEYEVAADALKTAVSQAPGMVKAFRSLVDLFTNHLKNDQERKIWEEKLKSLLKGKRSILTGPLEGGKEKIAEWLIQKGIKVETVPFTDADNGYILPLRPDVLENAGETVLVMEIAQLMQIRHQYDFRIVFVGTDLLNLVGKQFQKYANERAKKEGIYPTQLQQLNEDQHRVVEEFISMHPEIDWLQINGLDFEADSGSMGEKILEFLFEMNR